MNYVLTVKWYADIQTCGWTMYMYNRCIACICCTPTCTSCNVHNRCIGCRCTCIIDCLGCAVLLCLVCLLLSSLSSLIKTCIICVLHVYDVHVLMRDEKEGRKKQARRNKQQGKETQHTQGSHFSQSCLGWNSRLYSLNMYMYIIGVLGVNEVHV